MNPKTLVLERLLMPAVICLLFGSCRVEEAYFNITEPADVTIPTYVKRIGIINRSILSDSNGVRRTIDEILSVKGSQLDKDCSNESIRGLKDALVQSNLFKATSVLDSVHLYSHYPDAFPAPLSWDQVGEICSKNNVDALFSLELFHTGNRVAVAPSPAGLIATGIASLEQSPNMHSTVSAGWRIYDPQGKIILDEFPMSQALSLNGAGINGGTVEALMDHKEVVMATSYQLGQAYGARILPVITRVCREFFIRGNINFKIARRMADAGDWDNAAKIWDKETANPKARLRARGLYNMAMMSEMNGDVDGALGLAQKAYETGGRRIELFYLNILQDRQAENDVLKAQKH